MFELIIKDIMEVAGYHHYAIDALKTYELEEIDYGNNRT